jgi:hypothetical protein
MDAFSLMLQALRDIEAEMRMGRLSAGTYCLCPVEQFAEGDCVMCRGRRAITMAQNELDKADSRKPPPTPMPSRGTCRPRKAYGGPTA